MQDGGRRRPSDQAERDVAVRDLDHSHVVEAGAGTGKTKVLVDRVLELVRTGAAPLDRIVAITFTEKAAGELKVRLRQAIEGTLAAGAPGDDDGRLAAALADLERAPIETIHAFAARLIRDRPVEARVDPRFETLDELRSDLLLDATWAAWLEETLTRGSKALRNAYAVGLGPETWRILAQRLVATRASRTPATMPPPLPDAAAFIERTAPRLAAIAAQLASAVAAGREDRFAGELGRLAAELESWRGGDPIEAIAFLLRDFRLPGSRSGNQRNYRSGALLEARNEIAVLVAEHEDFSCRAAEAILRGLLAGLEDFVVRHEASKRERGALDFDDLLIAARDLLQAHPEVRRELATRYRYFLVDEFQDTDPLQAEIVFLLCDGSGAAGDWREVEVPPGKLFLVGDPKQSIYRFRRADIELYEAAKRRLLGARPALVIAENFRSDAGLIAWVNSVFSGEMTPPPDGAYQPAYQPLVAHHIEARSPRAVVALEPEPGSLAGLKVPQQREREAAAIAGLMRQAVTEKWPVRSRDGSRRGVVYGDMALLLRAMPDIEIYEEALRQAGVPYRITGGKDYYRRAEVQALLRVLEAVDDPGDEIAIVAALRSSFFGVGDDLLLAHAASGRRFDYLARERGAAAEVDDAFACLRQLRGERNRLDPAALIRAVLDRTKGAALAALKPHGEQRVANLLKLADEAAALAEAGLDSLRAVVRWLADLERREVDESESPLAEEGDEAVRVMTVHKAKGLEFGMVVVADLGRDTSNDRLPLLVDGAGGGCEARVKLRGVEVHLETLDYDGKWQGELRRLQAEALRLLYVAVTRARDILVLPLYSAASGAARARLPFLAALEGHLPGLGEGLGPGAERVHRVSAADLPEPPPRALFRRRLVAPFAAGAATRHRIAERQAWSSERRRARERAGRGVRLLLPSQMAVDAAGRESVVAAAAARDNPAAGVEVGRAVHAVLEQTLLGNRERTRVLAHQEAAARGLSGAARARVERLALAALAAPVVAEAIAAAASQREVPFTVRIGEALVEGFADLVFHVAGRGLTIVDWKTDAAARRGSEAVARVAGHYRPQALAYALAIERASREPVCEVVLVFLDGAAGPVEVRIVIDTAARREAEELFGLRPRQPVNLSLFADAGE